MCCREREFRLYYSTRLTAFCDIITVVKTVFSSDSKGLIVSIKNGNLSIMSLKSPCQQLFRDIIDLLPFWAIKKLFRILNDYHL